MRLLTPDEIKRVAAMQGRHAEERALLMGRHENERRELQAKQEDELLTEHQRNNPAIAPVVPHSGGPAPAARPTPRGGDRGGS
jgi:hypothetical protein